MTEENNKKINKEEVNKTSTRNHRTRTTKVQRQEVQKNEDKKGRKPYQRRNSRKNGLKEQSKNTSLVKVNEKNAMTIFKKSKLKIIPLGGLHEIGKNITVFEYENEMIVVDCGLSFPEDDMLGIDLVIPDITYLERNVDKIKGLVITHGHEDHIGAVRSILIKENKYTNLCNQINSWFNKKQIRRTQIIKKYKIT